MNTIPKTFPNLDFLDTSDKSTECDSPSLMGLSKKKINHRFEDVRINAIGSCLSFEA